MHTLDTRKNNHNKESSKDVLYISYMQLQFSRYNATREKHNFLTFSQLVSIAQKILADNYCIE